LRRIIPSGTTFQGRTLKYRGFSEKLESLSRNPSASSSFKIKEVFMNAAGITRQENSGDQQHLRLSSKGESSINSSRRIATLVGVLFIIGTVAGILSAVIAGPLLSDPEYLTKIAANANPITLGALCVLTMGLALALVPVVIFPVLKKHNEVLAFGYLVFRGALETFTYVIIVISWLLLLPLSREFIAAGVSNAAYFQTLGNSILRAADIGAAITSIIFPLGAMMLYVVFYQSKLIPRWISGWGIVAAVLTLVAGLTALFGINLDVLKYVMLPQEMVMAVWLIVKGFNPSVIASEPAKTALKTEEK
jgi:Domain of unknown function (DUF4386)